MLSRTAKSGNKNGVKRALSILLSGVLTVTLLQAFPATSRAAPPLGVDLIARYEDTNGVAASLAGSTITGSDNSTIYRLDLSLSCGVLESGPLVSNVSSPADNALVGLAEDLELQLSALRIVRTQGPEEWDMPVDCSSTSWIKAYLSPNDESWTEITESTTPQGSSNYFIGSNYPLPTLTTFDSEYNFLTTSRLNTFSNGFEIEWDQFEGSIGYTPAGYSLRYREVFNGEEQRGPWIYQRSADGRQKSLVVQDPLFQGEGPAFQYEVEVAPSVIDCDSNVLFGKFESIPGVGGFGLNSDPSSLTPNIPQMIEGDVESQCISACVPTETVEFDGNKLATVLKFTNTDACTWTVPSNFASGTVDAYIIGGGGGGGAAGGGGGGGGGFETSIDLPIAIDDTWTVRVGTGGVGSDLLTMRGDSGTRSSVTYPGSNGDETITALGGGGGGSKDNSGAYSGGDGIYTGAPLRLTYGGYGSGTGEAGAGVEGIARAQVSNEAYGDGGEGGGGSSALESSFIEEILASGGGGGAKCLPSGHEFYADYLGGISLNSGIGGSCQLPEGSSAAANTGGGGGGGASDGNGAGGTGGDGGSGVVFIVHTEEPLARYIPSGCVGDNFCTSWLDTTQNPDLTAFTTGAPLVQLTNNQVSNGSVLQDSIPVVQGIPSDSIVFPASVMPDNYTLFTVARYNEIVGGQYQRIFDGKSDGSGINWLSGFWGDSGGYSGVAFHGNSGTSSSGAGWLTPVNSIHDFDWVVSTDQNNLYRSNGTTRSYGDFTGGVAPDQLTINGGDHATQGGEASDFQVADIITFGRELSETEYIAVETYLSERYGICVSNCSPPEITTASTLDPGEVGTPYTTTIQVNGAAEVSFALSPESSPLPEGLSIDEQTGVISGIPTLDADFTFTIVVTNLSNGQSSSQEFTMTVNAIPPPPDPPVFTTTSPLLSGETGTPYLQTIEATSANSISYSVEDGELPSALSLNSSTGEIFGTPSTAGDYTFVVEATDVVNGGIAQREFSITINSPPPPDPPVFTTTSPLAEGEVNQEYTQTIAASSPYGNPLTYTVFENTGLPNGISLDLDTGELSGTPTVSGNYTFTVEATDTVNLATVQKEFTITIHRVPIGCEDYSEAAFVPNNFWLDSNGYPIGCDITGQDSVTPDTTDNGSWSQRFDSRVDLDFFNLRNGWICDDCSIGLEGEVSSGGPGPGPSSSSSATGLPLGFSFNYYGKTYDSVFVNSNGSLTFGAPSGCYDETLTQIMRCDGTSGTSAIVAYGVDLDNGSLNPDVWGNPQGPDRHTEFFYWGRTTTEDGKLAFVATWMNSPGYCEYGESDNVDSELGYEYEVCDFEDQDGNSIGKSYEDTLSTFQIVLIDQSSEVGGVEGDADVIINYGSMQDSQNGYTSCEILQGETGQDDPDCQPTSDRYLAVGLGSTQVNAENSDLWDSSVTSLEAVHPIIPEATLLYNGVDASLVGDLAPLALSAARQFEGSILVPGRFVYEFRANSSPEIATQPSTPVASLGSPTQSSITVTIQPPSDNGGAPVLTYGIEYRIAGETDWTPVPANIQYAEPDVTFEVGGLSPATSYEVRVTANNGIGDSEPTETLSLSTTAIQGAPETPAFALPNPFEIFDEGWVGYSWDALVPEPDFYAVRYRPTIEGSGNSLPWVTNIFNTGDDGFISRQYSTPILNPDTQYEFQISARNANGSSAWSDSELVTTSPVDERYLEAAGITWNGYGSEISTANGTYGGSGLVYDGALKVFIGESRSTAAQIECDQSTISHPGFDVGVEGKQGHYEWETAETRVQGGYTVTCAPEIIDLDPGAQEDLVAVSLSRFFFTESPWTRVMIDVTNLEATEIRSSVWLESKLQPDSGAGNTTYEVSSSASDPTSPETGDRWVVTGDNKESGMVVAHVFGQPLGDPNVSTGVNQDGGDLMLSEFGLDLPGTTSGKSNSARLAWFDGIVQYDVVDDADDLAANYSSAVATAKAAAESFTKVKSQLTDTYPRFVPPTLTNFRMPDQVRVSPGVFNDLKVARISGQDPTLGLSLNFNADFEGAEIPVTYKISNSAKLCIDNSLNGVLFDNDGNIEVENKGLLIKGTQADLNCFIQGLTFSIPTPPTGADSPGAYGYLFADLTELVSQRGLGEKDTKLIFEGVDAEQTLIDVEAGNATWRGVGTGINDVETRSNRNAYDEGSLEVYWIPNVNADPLSEGIKIYCPQDADTRLEENLNAKELICESDLVLTPDGDLSIEISRYFATSDPWQQLELNITNNEIEDLSGALAYRLDLGSDEHTEIEMTSDGDLNLESSDSWFITSDDGQRTDPVLLHYVGFESGQKITQGTDADVDKIWVKTPLRVDGETQVTKRYLEGVVDAPRGQVSDAVVVAMKAADQVLNQKFRIPSNDFESENVNILDTSLPTAVNEDRDLPALRMVYECRDFGRSAIYPVVVQNNGQPIGCDIGLRDGGFSEEMDESSPLDEGLYPSDEPGDEKTNWIQRFRSTFPNATPRLGWACDMCMMTSEGPIEFDLGETPDQLADGLPLGFTTSTGGQENLDSVRILPQGIVQLHSTGDGDPESGVGISAFANIALGNGSIQGNWDSLPDYDFFYWGRTVYQGRLAFVVTWVKIPSLDSDSTPFSGDTTTMQLILVSDSYPSELGNYLANPEGAQNSNVDIIWNYDTIRHQGAISLLTDSQDSGSTQIPFYAGVFSPITMSTPLVSDAFTTGDDSDKVGLGEGDCYARCVSENLLGNRLQSPVDGRYVMGFRTYEILTEEPNDPVTPDPNDPVTPDPNDPVMTAGIVAPASPRSVEVSRSVGNAATVSWQKPLPWVISMLFDSADGVNPILGYRIEYATNTRGEDTDCGGGEDGPSGCYTTFPELTDEPLSASSESVTVTGSGAAQRLSVTIPELDEKENYTFRIFAVYSGIDFLQNDSDSFPPDLLFDSEIRSAPATADEQHDSDLQIVTVATDLNPMAPGAQGIAGLIAGDLEVSNATVNGSPYAYGQTAKSIATFSGGEDSIGFDEGIVISPLTDARTFQRGSGITAEDSSGKAPSYFANPNHRAKYFETANDFTDFLNTQESWIPEREIDSVTVPGGFDSVCREEECANGTTVLQFDIAKPDGNDFLKFEYALAGLETTTGNSGNLAYSEVFAFPDGFGLFIGDINQESSCALVPQIDDETNAQRFMSMGNALNARLATEVEFNSDLNAETVSSVMSCNFDLSEIDSETITITMAIANANDAALSTAVFIKSDSLRFEPTSITLEDIPSAKIYKEYETKQFSATGTAPTSWSAENLPGGMSLTSLGLLEGTPTETGSFNFTVNALDAMGIALASQAFSIQIDDVERGSEVRNVRISLYDDELTWEHPLESPEGMLYDVYYRADLDQEYELARGKKCTEVSNDRCLDFGGNTIPVQDFTDPFVDLRDSYDANTNYQFKIVARWPGNASYSETMVMATSWRDVCSGENSCSYTQSGRITNEAFWEEITYGIEEAQTIQGNEDAFDGALNVYIGDGDVSEAHRVSCDFSTLDVIRDEELEDIIGHEIVCSDDIYEDLEIKLSRYFFSDEQWTRTMVEVTNNDQNDEFNGTVWLVSDLGSDSDTFYEATSDLSSQPGLDPVDTWAVTSDARDDEDPILIHMLGELKDEDYSTLSCWASDGTLDEDERTRNSNSCGQMVAGHDVSVSGGATTKKAWFTGLVGYSDPLLFDSAKNRAILAAGVFASDETTWTGDMSSFEVPSLFYEIPELTCESVGGGSAPEGEQPLSVVLLNKQLQVPDGESNQSSLSSATALATQLCNSPYLSTTIFAPYLSTTIFDGGNGSESGWKNALADADVLVLPETESDLLGSDLLQTSDMAHLTEWVRDGGRIVVVGASQYRTELENIIGIPAGTLQVGEWESSAQVPRLDAAEVFGGSLPVANGDLSKSMLKFDDSFSEAVNLVNVNAISLYGGSTDDGQLSAVTKFEIGRGQASYLSSNFEGDRNANWDEALLHSVYGTETEVLEITESGKTWNLWRSGVYWSEMDSAASFKLGSIGDSTSLACVNTPTNPAMRKVSSGGTEILCGKQLVQDGLVDAGVSVQLSRFVFASGDWMYSSIVVTNNDREDTYRNQIWFGGSQNLSSSMRIEATSRSPSGTTNLSGEGTTNLSGEQQDSDGSSEWIVASEGAGINNVHGDSTSEVVTHIFDPRPNTNHGGSNRDSWLRMDSDEIQSDWWISLESDQSISISALTGRMSYEPGCDRTAVEISKQAALTITKSEGPLEFPSLRTDCESLSATTTSLSAQNSGTNVSVSWSSVATATHYELSYRVGSSGEWTSPTSIPATADTTMSTLIPGLNRSTDYEFSIRAKRINFGSYGDNAIGPWAENVATLRTSAKPIVRKAQASPTAPKATTVGKTVKFAMKTKAGLALAVSSTGACKTTKITTSKKVGSKFVVTQTGWLVTPNVKGVCSIRFRAPGNTNWNPLDTTTKVTVSANSQVSPTVPKTLLVKKTVKFAMKTKAGLALAVSSTGACKTTKITVTKKVGKKTTTTQTGWLVTATKKGNCTVTLKAKGNTRWLPMNIRRIVKVS